MPSRAPIHLKLTVTDSNGCTATAKLTVTQVFVYGAKAAFTWKPSTITPGFPIHFYNTTVKNTGVTYLWRFAGDGSTSTSPDSLIHIFPNIGTDTVTLIAYPSMPGACIDTLVQILQIQNIAATFTYTDHYLFNANCPPLVANFVSQTLNTIGLHWDFGDGGTADNNPNPNHTYQLPGTYIITLTGFGANGITTTYQDSLTVKGPFGTLYSNLLTGLCSGNRYPACNGELCGIIYLGFWRWNGNDDRRFLCSTYVYTYPEYLLPRLF